MSAQPIWPNGIKIEVLGVTGAYGSGKTLFVLSIDPEHTRYYDFEKSGGTYEGLGVNRIDVPAVMLEKYPKGYSPRHVFEWWYSDIKLLNPGGYAVVVGDPISDIEDGLVEWVKARHAEWGFKSAESFVATGGIFWAKVKSEWKRVLADLSARCQTFAFTTHLKFVWNHGKPTTQQVPKGKSTLMELSSLFLFLERDSSALVPSATVLKSRLAVTKVVDGEIHIIPALPPRIAVATPKRIREYIITPPDYGKLAPDEIEQEKQFSEADKLELEAQIAADRRAAEEAALQAAQTTAKIQSAREVAMAKLRPAAESTAAAEEPSIQEPMTQDPLAEADPKIENAPTLIEEIIASGKLIECARIVWKKLHGRGIDLGAFKGAEFLGDFLHHLNPEELSKLRDWLKS